MPNNANTRLPGPINAPQTSLVRLVGATFNAGTPNPNDGEIVGLQCDAQGRLIVTGVGSMATTVNQGSPNTIANSWPVEITDGTNVLGTAAHPIRVDPTGTTIQPISGSISFTAPQHVIVDSGAGAGVQFADNAASGATPTGTLAMGWDSANSKIRALKVDTSQNLEVAINAALPAGTNVIGHVIVDSGAVSVTQTTNPWIVAGAKTPADSFTNPTDAVDTFALLGGWDNTNSKWQRVQVDAASGTLKVDPGTVTISFSAPQHVIVDSGSITVSGSVSVSNFPATQNVTGTTTDGTTTETNFLVVGGESNDATAQYQPIPLGTGGRSIIIEGFVGGTAVPISGSVSVSNFPTTVDVTDRAARLVGIVYGSQSQQLKQTATNFNLQVELATSGTLYDARQIRALTSADVVTANQGGAPWSVTFPSAQHVIVDSGSITVSGTVTANQGTPNTLANAWPVEVTDGIHVMPTGDVAARAAFHLITDGTNGPVTVKPANTIPTSGDSALVVALTPGSGTSWVELLQTLILETRAMRTALVYAVTENGDVKDSDFDPASQDFQPVP